MPATGTAAVLGSPSPLEKVLFGSVVFVFVFGHHKPLCGVNLAVRPRAHRGRQGRSVKALFHSDKIDLDIPALRGQTGLTTKRRAATGAISVAWYPYRVSCLYKKGNFLERKETKIWINIPIFRVPQLSQ